VVHNCAHTHPFKYSLYNKYFFIILTLLSGSPVSLYVPGHNKSHHDHLETEKDMMRTTQMTYKNDFWNFILFVPTILPGIIQNEQKYMKLQKDADTPFYRQYLKETLTYHIGLCFLFFINWKKTLFVYFLPTLIGKFMIISLNMLQHYDCDPSSKYNHSRNFTGPLLNFLCLNNGYHTAHHLVPGLHWSKLKMKHKEIEKEINETLIHDDILKYMVDRHFFLKI
tara:strand:+ start:164 stop:835 length:672 start_codon:yes stop_codon:yes gene_type:complete